MLRSVSGLVSSPHIINPVKTTSSALFQASRRAISAVSEPSAIQGTGDSFGYKGIQFSSADLDSLSGGMGSLSQSDPSKMIQHRSEVLKDALSRPSEDGRPGHYNFLGTDSGLSAISVIIGGKGRVGPYAGGWQGNAQSSRRLAQILGACPDLLHVSFEEPGNLAAEFNGFIRKASQIQHLLQRQAASPSAPLGKLTHGDIQFEDTVILADLEQGFRNFQKTRDGVNWCIQNGVNVIHIEDQGRSKRCGHLGGKELASSPDFFDTLKVANFAAQQALGPEQASQQWVQFVARTDALSAERIEYSDNLKDINHPDYPYIDWTKGVSADGQYLYLKQGNHPETGIPYGLSLSIDRSAHIIDQGLAPFVWMETPTGDLHMAKAFVDGVNERLAVSGKRGRFLYNHSPSFEWDIQTFVHAEPLAKEVGEFIATDIFPSFQSNPNRELACDRIQAFISKQGDSLLGDTEFSRDLLTEILGNGLDLARGPEFWGDALSNIKSEVNALPFGLQHYRIEKLMDKVKQKSYRPERHIANCIVANRLKSYERQLQSIGVELNLCTLPEWHAKTLGMTELAAQFADEGINGFVQQYQRPARKAFEQGNHPLYSHQTWSGVPVEVELNQLMGSQDTSILSGSTEAQDRATATSIDHLQKENS